MAIAIKAIPTLTGEDAERFVLEAEENGKRPTPFLSPERKAKLKDFLESSRLFQLQFS